MLKIQIKAEETKVQALQKIINSIDVEQLHLASHQYLSQLLRDLHYSSSAIIDSQNEQIVKHLEKHDHVTVEYYPADTALLRHSLNLQNKLFDLIFPE